MGEQSTDDWFMREVLPLEPALTRFLRRNWRNAAEIADLRQDVYARLYEAASRDKPLQTKPFVFQVARNLLVDRVRQQSVVPIETMGDFDWRDVSEDAPSPEAQVAARQELRILQAALDTLPARCRQVVILRKVQGLSQKDVARQMGITVETVENQVTKGMRLLTDFLSQRRSSVTAEARRYNFLKRLK